MNGDTTGPSSARFQGLYALNTHTAGARHERGEPLEGKGIADRYERLFSTLLEERAGRSVLPPPGPAGWRDRAAALAATAGILARGAVRRGRRALGWVG
jgi:hypothetical protein